MFLVFAGDNYYPEGGWHDFIGSYATLEEAKQGVVQQIEEIIASDKWLRGYDWIHIASCDAMDIVVKAYVECAGDENIVVFKENEQ